MSGLVVGVDLGTTHTVVAYADPERAEPPTVFAVPQLVAVGREGAPPLLPSALYAPLDEERTGLGDLLLGDWIVGEHARRRDAELPGRVVSSAKSWLSHGAVDRTAPILPWRASRVDDEPPDAGEEHEHGPRLSPVDASTVVLEHVRRAWDRAFPRHPLAAQDVVLTVPASFDAVARELTVTAAAAAGLRPRLLEEPQAAFYDWLGRAGTDALAALLVRDGRREPAATVLVCDLGGGTTDLSLLRVGGAPGAPAIERVAVGRHLLLGGDNMDLALAELAERRMLGEQERLDAARFAALVAGSRAAKERLLGDDAPERAPIAVAGPGARLVGATLRTELGRDEVHALVLDGFFPRVGLADARPPVRAGLVAFGLPYERDVAVTRHLAAFVARHTDAASRPAALLLNGGPFTARRIAERVALVVGGWCGRPLALLDAPEPALAVARGAVRYGMALRGRGTRIGGGSPRAYFVAVATESEEERLVCVLPRRGEEGVLHRACDRRFSLVVGRAARFLLYSAEESAAKAGELVARAAEHERAAALVTTLPAELGGAAPTVAVEIEACLTALGTLELRCVTGGAEGAEQRVALGFDLGGAPPAEPDARPSPARWAGALGSALEAVDRVLGPVRGDVVPREAKDLLRTLERRLGPRRSWELELCRTLGDRMLALERGRRRSPDHERLYWLLAGFCLRPGRGAARDPERTAALFALFAGGIAHREARVWQQFWIAWRRVSAGLGEAAELALRDVLDPMLAPAERRLKVPKSYRNEARSEMLELAAGLERLPPARRAELGGWILERTWTERDPRLWSALGRVGARAPTYGGAHQVVPPRTAERWLDHLLREKWDEIATAPAAAVALARITLDRARDVSERIRAQILGRLERSGAPAALLRPLREHVPLGAADARAFYGEDLPVGLSLIDAGRRGRAGDVGP